MNPKVPAQPQQQANAGRTCLGMGCVTVAVLLAFLACAFIGGGLWAVHHFKETYTSAEPEKMPETLTSDEPIDVQSSASAEGTTTSSSANSVATAPSLPAPQVKELEKRWKSFDKAADREEKARVEFTAEEINALLQSGKNTRGRVFVSIENNVGHVRFSIPLKNVPMVKNRYLNGEATVEASPDGDPNKARISNIKLANSSVSDGVLNQRFFGVTSGREAIKDWLRRQNIETFRIENNRVIGETRGD